MIAASELFQQPLPCDLFEALLDRRQPVHQWLPAIACVLQAFFKNCPFKDRTHSTIPSGLTINGEVFIGENVRLPAFGTIEGPAYIGNDCELRPGVYIRGNVIVGNACVLGNSCEFKNALLFDEVAAPHFNYVGDSILGYKAHLGAGSILSNLRFDCQPVRMRAPSGEMTETGLKKLGAMVGDSAEIGCNAVLQPGSCLFPQTIVFPGEIFKGTRVRSLNNSQKSCSELQKSF